MHDLVCGRWVFEASRESRVWVVPDGCRDVIFRCAPGDAPEWWVSELDERTREVTVPVGSFLYGMRLAPGVQVHAQELLRALTGREPDGCDVAGMVQQCCAPRGLAHEALLALGSGVRSVAEAAQLLSVSPRSLQRWVVAETSRPPLFWLHLARARRAARGLTQDAPLAEIAAEEGFSDQAHMTREFRRWFGVTPSQARAHAALQLALEQPGYG